MFVSGSRSSMQSHAMLSAPTAATRRLTAQRVEVRAAVLHHREHPGCSGSRPVLLRAIRIAMAPMQAVEVARFMGGMDRHAREARLLEIDHTRARNLID